jgi:hypothetical protein
MTVAIPIPVRWFASLVPLLLAVGCGASTESVAVGANGTTGTTADLVAYCRAAESFFVIDEGDHAGRKAAFEKLVATTPPAIRSDAEAFLPLANDLAEGRPIADADMAKASLERIAVYTEDHCPDWGVERQGEALVLRKVIDGRKFFAVAPGSGSKVEPQSDRLVVAWNLDRDSC